VPKLVELTITNHFNKLYFNYSAQLL